MSSQPLGFPPVPFSAAHSQRRFRLMELPPELATMIEERQKSGALRLQFKSAAARQPAVPTKPAGYNLNVGPPSTTPGFLHLCSDDKVWAVKQVSTSNSVYITEPTAAATTTTTTATLQIQSPQATPDMVDGDGDTDMAADGTRQPKETGTAESSSAARGVRGPGITTISQVKNILELIPVEPDPAEVEANIRAMVPLYYDSFGDREELELGVPNIASTSLKYVVDNIPAPAKVISDTTRRLFVFSLANGKEEAVTEPAIYIPTRSLLLRAWRALMQQCAISGVKVDTANSLDNVLEDLRKSENEDVETFRSKPNQGDLVVPVVEAILRRFTHDASCESDNSPSAVTWKREEAAVLVGRWVLEENLRVKRGLRRMGLSPSICSLQEFRNDWTELLPDSWTNSCDVAALVRLVEGVELAKDGQTQVLKFVAPSTSKSATSSKTSADDAKTQKKRKWHEKFGAQRNAAVAAKR